LCPICALICCRIQIQCMSLPNTSCG
jgi:hypothetical protein